MALNAEVIRAWTFEPVRERYDRTRCILYALGVGAGAGSLDLVYEAQLKAMPTMAVVLAGDGPWMTDPRTGITFAQVLHGEQRLELLAPLPTEGEIIGCTRIEGVYDKGPKGAVLLIRRDLSTADGKPLAIVRASAFARADGGFGGSSEGQPAPHPIPDRQPDLTADMTTHIDQALIYRLSGDLNPLHIDPAVAQRAGFERPILHGLCSYGVAARAVINALCRGDPDRLRRFDVRFITPVYPGETLSTEIWREGPGTAAFRVRVIERDVIAISNGRADYTA